MAVQSNASDIHLRSSQSMGLSALTPFSVTAWLNCNWTPGARRSYVGIYGGTTDTALATPVTAMQIGTALGTGDLNFWTWGGGTLVASATGFMTPFNNLWVFIAYTFDGTTHRGYRNGVLAASATTAQQPGFLNQVYINGYPGGGTSEVDAFQVDQYHLFRRALTDAELLTMFHAGGARHGIVNGLIARYEFDEGVTAATASNVVDMSGNNHALTPTGIGAAMTYTYTNTFANSNIRPVQ